VADPGTTRRSHHAVPFMVSGLWIDFKLFGKINDETFRKTVLVLLLFAGLSLIVSMLGGTFPGATERAVE
jgi:hypothetical protein